MLVLLLAAVLVATGVSPLNQAQALTKTSTLAPSDQAKSFAYFKALRHCFEGGWFKNSTFVVGAQKNSDMSSADSTALTWFHPQAASRSGLNLPPLIIATFPNAATVGVINEPEDGDINCGETAWLQSALALWGYSSGPEFLCALGFTRDVNKDSCTEIIGEPAINNFRAPDNPAGKLDTWWTKTMGVSGTDVQAIGPGEYRLLLDSFKTSCAVSASGSDYAIREYDPATKTWSTKKYGQATRDQGNVRLYQDTTKSCAEIAAQIDSADDRAVKAYTKWLVDNDGQDDGSTTGTECQNGATVDSSGKPCGTSSPSSCAIEGVGWILCPVLTAGAGLADGAYKFLADSFLATDISLVNTNPTATTEDGQVIGTGTFTAWRIMQGIGNVAFIIAVLIIIFSQLTGIAISNYGVKKLLPRVVVAAILVNLSFLICQIAVDVSNVLGYSIKGVLEGVAQQVKDAGGGAAAPTGDQSGNLAGIAATVLVVGSAAWINIGALFVAVVGAVIALLTIFVLLVVRKVLIVLLIVIAPLAFVAYLLPNTESLFHKWRKLLTTLLLLFPIIGVLYGACLLASAVLLQVAGTDPVLQIAAYMALVIPLIAAIPLLKGSLDGIGKIGGAIQSFGQKTRGAAQGGAKKGYDRSRLGQFKKFKEGVGERRRAQIRGGTFRGTNRNPLNWGRNLASVSNRGANRISGQFGSEIAAAGADLSATEDERAIKSASSLMIQQTLTSNELMELAQGREVRRDGRIIMRQPNEPMRQAAVREKMKTGTTGEVEQLLIGSAGAPVRVRQEMARGIHSNGHPAKADYLGGDFADRVLRGEVGSAAALDDAAARRIQNGRLSAETMVSQDADALERFARVSADASVGTRTDINAGRLDELRDHAVEATTNDQLRSKITGQKADPIDTMSRL